MKLSDFDYTLPAELIAQTPLEFRDRSRLMVLDPMSETIDHRLFNDLPDILKPSDLLVINDTRVFSARLVGNKEHTGGEVELFLLHKLKNGCWDALSRPARRLKSGTRIEFFIGQGNNDSP